MKKLLLSMVFIGMSLAFYGQNVVRFNKDSLNRVKSPFTGEWDLISKSTGGSTGGTCDCQILPIATITSDTTLDNTHYTVLIDPSAILTDDHIQITLPDPATCTGRLYILKLISLSNNGDGNGGFQFVNDVYLIKTSHDNFIIDYKTSITIQSSGDKWWIIDYEILY